MEPLRTISSSNRNSSTSLLDQECYNDQELTTFDAFSHINKDITTDPDRHNELFAQDQCASSKPWWMANFFVSEPILFGTWDGVFTSCMINLFGVIVFLRSGWIVAEAGIAWSVIIVLTAVLLILLSVLSGIGICEKCVIDQGGVYFILSHILGARFGGSMGILYCFGQAVSAALHSIGFGESIGMLIGVEDIWVQRGIAAALLLFLVGVNITGVVWVVKLQFVLLMAMLLAVLDFVVGSCVHTNPSLGVDGYYSDNFRNNSAPAYSEGKNLFTVFGVFFPALTGVFAGINMSGDLRQPSKNIPEGTLSSIGVCCILYLAFIIILGSTCQRSALRNPLIAEKVSALGVLFLCGLYTSSIASCLGTLYGTPRILQSIANENVMPFLQFLGKGRGPNKIPIVGICVVAVVTLLFILVGHINSLAPVVTLPFLMTYAAINYAYFSLSMSIDMQNQLEQKFRAEDDGITIGISLEGPTVHHYGATHTSDHLENPSAQSDKSTLPLTDKANKLSETSEIPTVDIDLTDQQILQQDNGELSGSLPHSNSIKNQPHRTPQQRRIWYYALANRWVALITMGANIVLMFFVHWLYALILSLSWLALHVYTGKANSGSSPGISNFKFCQWFLRLLYKLCGKSSRDQIVLKPLSPYIGTSTAQLTQDNDDFANRKRYHRASIFDTQRRPE